MDQDQFAQSAQTDPGRHIPSQGGYMFRVMIPETENLQEAKGVYPGKSARHA